MRFVITIWQLSLLCLMAGSIAHGDTPEESDRARQISQARQRRRQRPQRPGTNNVVTSNPQPREHGVQTPSRRPPIVVSAG